MLLPYRLTPRTRGGRCRVIHRFRDEESGTVSWLKVSWITSTRWSSPFVVSSLGNDWVTRCWSSSVCSCARSFFLAAALYRVNGDYSTSANPSTPEATGPVLDWFNGRLRNGEPRIGNQSNTVPHPNPTHTINQNGTRIQSNRQTSTTGTEIRRRRKARPLTRFRSRTGALADDSRSDERGSHPLRWLIRSKAIEPSDPWRGTGIHKRLANITVLFLNRSTFAVTSSVFH